jgi:hypothetical protein
LMFALFHSGNYTGFLPIAGFNYGAEIIQEWKKSVLSIKYSAI